LFGLSSGGNETATVTSGQAGSFLNSLFGNISIPQQQDLGSFVQSMRLPDGTLPFGGAGTASGTATQQQQDATAAFNALFGPGGSADFAQNITGALLPQPMAPSIDPSGVPGFLNTTSTSTGSLVPATSGTGSAATGTGPGAAGTDLATLGPGAGLNLNPISFQVPAADRSAALQDTSLQGDTNVSQSLSGLQQFAQLVPVPGSTATIPDQTVLPGGFIPSGMGIQVIAPGGEIVTVNSSGAQVTVPAGVGPNGAEPQTTFPLTSGITLESGSIQVPGNQGIPALLPGDYKLGNPPADPSQPDTRPTLTILPQSTSNQTDPTTDGSAATAVPAAPAAPATAAPADNTDDGTGNGGVVTTVPASNQVSGPDLSSIPATPATLSAPAPGISGSLPVDDPIPSYVPSYSFDPSDTY
jgi:hypothetical protein